MKSVPDSKLVLEIVALSTGDSSPRSKRPYHSDVSEQQGDVLEDQLIVLFPPPPSAYGYSTTFRHDPELIVRSRQAMQAYERNYREEEAQWHTFYPWRWQEARHTGLPAFLRGFRDPSSGDFDRENDDRVFHLAGAWLSSGLRAEALGGGTVEETIGRLRSNEVVYVPSYTQSGLLFAHARFQQYHQEWPVYGGGMVVHLMAGDVRTAVTSSYFPIPTDAPFTPVLSPTEAIDLAQQVLAGYLEEDEAIGFYWHSISPWLKTTTPDLVWKEWHTYVASTLLKNTPIGNIEQIYDATVPDSIGTGIGEPSELLAALRQLWKLWYESDTVEWRIEIASHEGSDLFIFPFNGNYYLAYQVELISPAGGKAWRVFVDAVNGQVLGRPEDMVAHAQYYNTAANTLNNAPQAIANVTALKNEVARFARLSFHNNPAQLTDLVTLDTAANETTQRKLEMFNVAFHANKMYDHFIAVCGADPLKLQGYQFNSQQFRPGLQLQVGKVDTLLKMGFIPAINQNPQVITFQTDNSNGAGLDGGGPVHNPSLDPEVVSHEIVHGLMWLLNKSPFAVQNSSVPFSRALTEGYANYFARSLADRLDNTSNLWARAGYQQADWGGRWSLQRNTQQVGADLLPAPNLYPETAAAGLPVYDVGMIWARALWDIRRLLGNADLADKLALQAYQYIWGWVSDFEQAAEGLIDAATKAGVAHAELDAIINSFAARRILAEQGVQALANANGALLMGTDSGLQRSTNNGLTWGQPERTDGGEVLTGVVALAVDGLAVYAATERGIYQQIAGNRWQALAGWPATQVPLCLLATGNKLYVGTTQEVWWNDNGWKRWGDTANAMVLQMADVFAPQGGNNPMQLRYAAQFTGVSFRDTSVMWRSPGAIPNNAKVTSMAANNNTVYAGTLSHGIWIQLPDRTPGVAMPAWQPFVSGQDINSATVLCLAVNGNTLLVGTTAGLFEIALNGGAVRSMNIPIARQPTVTAVLPAGQQLLVGTATDGLWRGDIQGNWQRIHNIG